MHCRCRHLRFSSPAVVLVVVGGGDGNSAAGAGIMLANLSGFAMCWGLLTGMDTLGEVLVVSDAL
jgi:hypothetical protein